jgi:PIN domain nuclease of toxin-antitoxin system
MTVALDSSAVLALIFGEPGGDRVARVVGEAVISAVNLSEIIAKLVESGYRDDEAERAVDGFLPSVMPFDVPLAIDTGTLRRGTRQKGLSLGDRACLALARREDVRVLTADRAWADLDIGVEIEVIR